MTGADAVAGVLVFALLCGLYLGPWQWACADYARQAVFEERDALFDMAHAGELQFGSEAYEITRGSMNALIRFAHRASLPRLVFCLMLWRPSELETDRVRRAIATIEDERIRKQVLEHVQRAEAHFIASAMMRSLGSFCVMVLIVGIGMLYRRMIGGPARSFRDTLDRVGAVVQAEATAVCA